MNKIQLLKEPGYIYDLNYIFFLKFNKEIYLNNVSDEYKKEYMKNVSEIEIRFGEIPDDLYVFFHAIENKRAFLPNIYFTPYKEQFATTFNFKFLLKELSDQNRLIRNLIKFYLYDLSDEETEECLKDVTKLFYHIKTSHYSDEEKSKLYEFFINPAPYIQTLQFELLEKDAILSEYYKNNYQKILDIYNNTTYDELIGQLSSLGNLSFLTENGETFYTSYCLLNKYVIAIHCLKIGVASLLGCNYSSMIGVRDKKKNPNLGDFCFALCEESRVKILQFLFERGEATCKDLEKEFTFSGSTAYHHITIMTRLGLVKTRNEGKTIFYSVDNIYVYDIIDILKNLLAKKGTQHEKKLE